MQERQMVPEFAPPVPLERMGAVAIGRNEGERLVRCLRSLGSLVPRVVYVDSGSTDGSVEAAEKLGVTVVNLDTSQGFTAARARNAGLRRLRELAPDLELVQFVDGDCELVADWLERATRAFETERQLAVACGRRRERYPDRSRYNRLCDMEWNTPIGEARACGGDALIRVSALEEVGGYRETLIAGEEPEMCVRLRQRGWRIMRLDAEMTLHDAAMFHAWQWYQRAKRCGHAYAEGAWLHGAPPERHCVRESRRIWFWALIWPLLILTSAAFSPWALLGLLVYPLQAVRIAWSRRQNFRDRWGDCLAYGVACVLSKWPELLGQIEFRRNQSRGRQGQLIEYK